MVVEEKFPGGHFPKCIVLHYRDIEELIEERGIELDHATVQRWVVKYSPLIIAAFLKKKKAVGSSCLVTLRQSHSTCPSCERCPVKTGVNIATLKVDEAQHAGAVRHHKYMGDAEYRKGIKSTDSYISRAQRPARRLFPHPVDFSMCNPLHSVQQIPTIQVLGMKM